MEAKVGELRERLREVHDLAGAAAVLSWDQSTYMPPGGAAARARQVALLSRLVQEKRTDPAVGRLLDDLEPYAERLAPDSDTARLIRVARREYERNIKVPPSFSEELVGHVSESYMVWAEARPKDDFSMVRPYLERTLALSRQLAGFFPGYQHIADPLIAFTDYGMDVATLRPLFASLRAGLTPLVEAITEQGPVDDSCLHGDFDPAKQLAFGEKIINCFGYDFQRGRQDRSPHPFTISFAIDDVRITTRVREDDLSEALFSTLHEAGHAQYEQGIARDLEGTPLAEGTSSGVHESQSRLWENLVGRSLPFWKHFYPRLQADFPEQLGNVALDTFYRAINRVQPSLIRTDADEVTYNLHVMIRFDLEVALLEGELSVVDLPEAWHARYQDDLGLRAPSDRNGVLQDVHWFSGPVGGAFQGYTLGNIMSALFYRQALQAHPGIEEETARGEFSTLHGWLRENIYRHGKKFTASELVARVTGGPLTIEPYLDYLYEKFGAIYDLPALRGQAS